MAVVQWGPSAHSPTRRKSFASALSVFHANGILKAFAVTALVAGSYILVAQTQRQIVLLQVQSTKRWCWIC